MKVQIFENSPKDIARNLLKKTEGMYQAPDCILAIICLEGSAVLNVDTNDKLNLSKGKFALLNNKSFNVTDKTDNFKIRILKVDYTFLTTLLNFDMRLALSKLFCRPRVLNLNPTQLDIYNDVTRHLQVLLRNEDKNYAKEIITGYLQVFTFSSLWEMEREEQVSSMGDKREYDIADRFITLIKEYNVESRKVSFYADKLNVSPKYLSVLVKKATGRHPTEWIDDYTVKEIKTRLISTDDSIQSISNELGFSTPSHMTKFFHDKTGSTPKEYRRSKDFKPSNKD